MVARIFSTLTDLDVSMRSEQGIAAMDTKSISVEEALALEDRTELCVAWKQVFGRRAPRSLSKDLLRHSLVFGIQQLTTDDKRRQQVAASSHSMPPAVRTTFLREWHGEIHVVEKFGDSFLYRGMTYRSLTAVARRITGTHWPGPRFFGLRKREQP